MNHHWLFTGNETPEQIRQILLDNCEGMEEMTYTRKLSHDELATVRENFAANKLEVKEHNKELQIARDKHKVAVKPLKKEGEELLETLKSKHQEVEGKVYRLADQKSGMMEYVNLEGMVVHSRRLKPEEKQSRMFPIAKVAGE